MKNHTPLWTYPIFRLTVFLAAGIFLSDRFLPDTIKWEYPAIIFIFVSSVTVCLYHTHKFDHRHFFGWMAGLSFLSLGATLTLYEKEQISFKWSTDAQLYWGVVQNIPHPRGKTMQAEVRIAYMKNPADTLSEKGFQEEWIDRSILLSWLPDSLSEPLQCGDSICFYGQIKRPVSMEAITGFDYGKYLERKGISGTGIAFSGNWLRIKKNDLNLTQHAMTLQQQIVERYRQWGLEGDVLAVASALTVGDRSDLTPALEAVYSATGASHVLSLSGLHIGILAGILFILLRPLAQIHHGKLVSSCLIVLVLWGFAFISGLSSSVIRSVIMFSLYILATLVSKDRFSGGYSVTLAAFLMLLYRPSYLFDISFQLSFAAVYSILLFYPLFSSIWKPRLLPLKYVWNILALSMAAQLGTLPLILFYFGAFPTYFLLANLAVAPLSTCILGSALAALTLSSIPLIGDVSISLLDLSTDMLNQSMYAVQRLHGSQLTSLYISEFQLVLLFILLGYLYVWHDQKKHRSVPILAGLLLTVNLFTGTCLYEQIKPSPRYLCFGRSEVFTRRGKILSLQQSSNGLLQIDSLHIGIMKSDYWYDKQARKRLPLDYVYICKGFKGNLTALNRLFEMKEIILDTSLSESYRQYLIRECQLLKISYRDLSDEGSCLILL